MYRVLRTLLFLLPPESAHHVTLWALNCLYKVKLTRLFPKVSSNPSQVMGLHFPNPVGLAAGLDKNGEYIDALSTLGFGFIEVGTVTPKPQEGNPKPRLFRVIQHEAIINRMGFNNKGVDYLVKRLQTTRYKGVLGINIGKNKDTPLESAADDYLYCLKKVLPFASYVTINISSPNTANLRQLQEHTLLQQLLQTLKQEQARFAEQHKKYVPLLVKISPDLTPEQIIEMANIFLSEKIDGVIATNTTIERKAILDAPEAKESGGLSGKPLLLSSTEVVKLLHAQLKDQIPIIGCGGISSVVDAQNKLAAGASLLQLYTALIYQGPTIINNLARWVD